MAVLTFFVTLHAVIAAFLFKYDVNFNVPAAKSQFQLFAGINQ